MGGSFSSDVAIIRLRANVSGALTKNGRLRNYAGVRVFSAMPTFEPSSSKRADTMSAVSESMRTVAFGAWILRVDTAATSRCYHQLRQTPSGPACDCDPCRNFGAVRIDAVYPNDAIRLFDDLGIEHDQPFELSHYSRMPSGLHLYGGWHYFCGSIESGPASLRQVERVAPTSQIALAPVRDARRPFPSSGCVQLDFYIEVPWIINAPEPD